MITRLIQKVFVREFYRTNAGFFLATLGICFGFLRDTEHIALGTFLVSSPILTLIPIGIWLLYTIKIISFNLNELQKQQNQFLVVVSELTAAQQIWLLSSVAIMQLLPILLYGGFLLGLSIYFKLSGSRWLISITLLALVILTTGVSLYKIRHPQRQLVLGWFGSWVNRSITRPWVILFLEWLLRARTSTVFGTKLFALALLYAVSKLYVYDSYDWRLLGLGAVFAASAQALLVFDFHRLQNFHAQWMRNLSWSPTYRFRQTLLLFFILMLPELALLARYFPSQLSIIHLAYLSCLMIAIVALLYALLYVKDVSQDVQSRRLLGGTLSLMVAVLFGVPAGLLAVVFLITAYAIYQRYFYTFEFIAELDTER